MSFHFFGVKFLPTNFTADFESEAENKNTYFRKVAIAVRLRRYGHLKF